MSVRMELVDELRRRANVSYEEAKAALEACNEDLIEALVYLEKQNKIKPEQKSDCGSDLWQKFKRLVHKGNITKFIIKKRDTVVISIPVTAAVIITIFAPYITLFGIILALFTGHRIKFQGPDHECTKVNDMLSKVSDSVDSAKRKFAEDSSKDPASSNQ